MNGFVCETEINDTILPADDPIDRFKTTLHQIALKTIPRTSIKSKKKKKSWFNHDCKTSIQKRKQALLWNAITVSLDGYA